MASARRLPLPEIVALLAVAGIVWRLWPETVHEAPPELRCGQPKDALDCFLQVPGGAYWMGAQSADPSAASYDVEAQPNEGPVHVVEVSTFWISRTETTVGRYRACVLAGACDEADVEATGGYSTYVPVGQSTTTLQDFQPVNSITWKGASQLCAWLGGRLPTEAEWERAARGDDGRHWPWATPRRCPLPPSEAGFARLTEDPAEGCAQDGPVTAHAMPDPSPYGVIGLSGNLWEWTLDGYAPDAYTQHRKRNPVQPPRPTRAQRGGSWTATSPAEVRTTVRSGMDPEAKLNDVGFRCVFGVEL